MAEPGVAECVCNTLLQKPLPARIMTSWDRPGHWTQGEGLRVQNCTASLQASTFRSESPQLLAPSFRWGSGMAHRAVEGGAEAQDTRTSLSRTLVL